MDQSCDSINELRSQLDSANCELRLMRERMRLLQGEVKARRLNESGSVWYWQSEGGNDIASLSCPIVIHASDLRALLDARPIKPDSDDIDFDVLRRAYDFTIDWDGNVMGLVEGDHGFDYTGIKLSPETMSMFLCKRDTNEDLARQAHFYRPGLEVVIDALLSHYGFKQTPSSTWWSVVDFLHLHGHHTEAGQAHKRAMPIVPR